MSCHSNVAVVQFDTRSPEEISWIAKTCEVNKQHAENLGWTHYFISYQIPDTSWDPRAYKIHLFNEFLTNHPHNHLVVFLDTDAWISNPVMLLNLITDKLHHNIQGIFSRDPYPPEYNTYLNTGGFIVKNNDYTKSMFSELAKEISTSRWKRQKYHDQRVVSEYVLSHRKDFFICKYDILNSPDGKIITHQWHGKPCLIPRCRVEEQYNIFSLDDVECKQPWKRHY